MVHEATRSYTMMAYRNDNFLAEPNWSNPERLGHDPGVGSKPVGDINDILDFNKIASGKLVLEKLIYSADVVMSVVRINQYRAAEKGTAAWMHFEGELEQHTYLGDPVRLTVLLKPFRQCDQITG